VAHWGQDSWREILEQICDQSQEMEAHLIPVASVVTQILRMMVKKIPQDDEIGTNVIIVLELCHSTRNLAPISTALRRMLDPGSTENTSYIENTLVPFALALKRFTVDREIPPTSQPYADIFKLVLMKWLAKVLGPKPHDVDVPVTIMQNVSGHCDGCHDVARFFRAEKEEVLALEYIGSVKRKHLEKQLQKHASEGVAKWNMISSLPQGLMVRSSWSTLYPLSDRWVLFDVQITKSAEVYQRQMWKHRLKEGIKLLKMISKVEEEQREVLGAEYLGVMKQLYGIEVPSASTLTAATTASAQVPAARKRVLSNLNRDAAATGSMSVRGPLEATDTAKKKRRVTGDIEVIDLT